MKIGSLFSGGGLGDLGWELAGFDLRWQVEIDNYCQEILKRRWPNVRRFQDIKNTKTEDLEEVDIISGGFPCQPFSVAGKRRGKDDDRNLWPEMLRIIKGVKPSWIVGENVPGIVNLALDTVLSDLDAEGYESWPVIFPAHALGAPHKRDRLWIVAHARREHGAGQEKPREHKEQAGSRDAAEYQRPTKCGEPGIIADANNERTRAPGCGDKSQGEAQPGKRANGSQPESGGHRENLGDTLRQHGQKPGSRTEQAGYAKLANADWWLTEPGVGRVVNGMPHRVDRLKCLGNGQLVQATYFIGELIKQVEDGHENQTGNKAS